MILQNKIRELQKTGVSYTKIAKSCGYSSAVISSWLKGNYKGDVKSLEKAINAFLNNLNEKQQQKAFEIHFVDTLNSRQVFALCKIAHFDKKMCVVTSDSGMGKTASLKEYSSRNPGTILIEVDPTYNPKKLFKTLHQKIGRSGKGLLENIYQDCVEYFKDSDRLVIVDEAELLNHKSIELLRRLYDKAGIGIILAGMPVLIENIRGIRSEFAQLYTRIGGSMKLKAFSKNDVKKVLVPYFNASNEIVNSFYNYCKQNGRTLSMLIFQVVRIVEENGCNINDKLIKQAAEMLEV